MLVHALGKLSFIFVLFVVDVAVTLLAMPICCVAKASLEPAGGDPTISGEMCSVQFSPEAWKASSVLGSIPTLGCRGAPGADKGSTPMWESSGTS